MNGSRVGSHFVMAIYFTTVTVSFSGADDLVFELDPLRSSISVTSRLDALALTAAPQGEGADRATYEGTISVRVDDPDSPSTIQFLSAEVAAQQVASWLPEEGGGFPTDPGDPEPAEFGFLYQTPDGFLLGAVRNSAVTITDEEPVAVNAKGMFNSIQHVETTAGTYDVNIQSALLGGNVATSVDLATDPAIADNVADPGSFVAGNNGVTTLTVPLALTFEDSGISFLYEGQLVATVGEALLGCDFDNSGKCDLADLDQLLYEGLINQQSVYDLDSSGTVDLEDRDAMLIELGSLPGDFDLSGMTNAIDLNILGVSWQQAAASYASGDANGDGFVDATDLNDLGIWWQATAVDFAGAQAAEVTTVPETNATALLLVVAMALSLVRRRG